MQIAVIGGGASGILAALSAKQANSSADVIIFEKNEKLGKKLFITGKGRCNVTNHCSKDEFFDNIVTNAKFLYGAYAAFDSQSMIRLLEQNGCPIKIERGNRVFPASDKSSDIIKCLINALNKNNVQILLNTVVNNVAKKDEKFFISTSKGKYYFDKVIIATGGFSYKATGSTGDGYLFAKNFGHDIIQPKPSLIGFVTAEKHNLAGLTLKNVTLKLIQKDTKRNIKSMFGEMLFTHNGISGPIALTLSTIANKLNLDLLNLEIDLKPALTMQQLDNRVLRDFAEQKNKAFKNSLNMLLPVSLADFVVIKSGIDPEKQVNAVTAYERKNLCNLIKGLTFSVTGFDNTDTAIVTSGGINVKEINPNTMESKLVKNLYFCGEVMDVDALTGGFNLQIAFSSGFVAGKNATI